MSNEEQNLPANEVDVEENETTEEAAPRRFRREGRGGGGHDRGNDRGRGRGRARGSFCPDGRCFDYKDPDTIRRYLTEVGKIKPRRQTGNCARCQRELAREVKRARHLALLPFVDGGD